MRRRGERSEEVGGRSVRRGGKKSEEVGGEARGVVDKDGER